MNEYSISEGMDRFLGLVFTEIDCDITSVRKAVKGFLERRVNEIIDNEPITPASEIAQDYLREIGVLETPQSIGTVMSCDSRI